TRLRLTDGRSAVMKTRPRAPEGFFAREAEGLRWLREVDDGAPVPDVLASSPECLILEWVEPTRPSAEAGEDLGRALSMTHAAGAEGFGARQDGYIGLAPLPNKPAPSWGEFYAARRVMPYMKAAVDRGNMTTEEAEPVEKLMHRIHDF